MLKFRFYIATILTCVLIAGCGGGKTVNKQKIDLSGETEELTLPITDEPITLKYWCGIYGQQPHMSENVVYQEISKRTGINFEFINPPVGQDKEQFGLMLASKDLPDLIERGSSEIYPGGVQKAINDKVFLKLNDYINKYAPNFKAILESDKDIRKMLTLDSGDIALFKSVKTTDEPPWTGPIIRADYLDKVGMSIPQTIDEWQDMLVAFKETLNIKNPMILSPSSQPIPGYGLTSAFNVSTGFYQVNGEVKYGPIEPGYKELLKTLNKWYTEGLIDREFASRDSRSNETMCISGESAAWFGPYDKLDYFRSVANVENKEYRLEAAPYLVAKKGDITPFIQKNFRVSEPSLAITASTKYPKEAVKLVDYFYSQDGYMLFNYGIENKTYTFNENNEPVFTDFMLNNPDGKPFTVLEYMYKRHNGPYLRNWAATPSVEREEIQEAMVTWAKAGTTDAALPPLTFTLDESSEMTSIMNNVTTYSDQFVTKAIMGLESIDNFDNYTETIKGFGMDKIIQYYQLSLERYNKR